MRFILVVDRKHLFPGLSPQGFLALDRIDLRAAEARAFFAEREFMEECSHFKQIIPYIALRHGDHVLCYQRQAKHSEKRLGGLWTVGFGGHIEPIDRHDDQVSEIGLLAVAALRELEEETGLRVRAGALRHHGFINSEREDVSSVHFGVFYSVDLSADGQDRDVIAELVTRQAEPHRVAWRAVAELMPPDGAEPAAPEGGDWEDWTRVALASRVLSPA